MWTKENDTDAGLPCWPDLAVELTTRHKAHVTIGQRGSRQLKPIRHKRRVPRSRDVAKVAGCNYGFPFPVEGNDTDGQQVQRAQTHHEVARELT